MISIDSGKTRIKVNGEGKIESIKCESIKDGVYYSVNAYPLTDFFKEVREIAFKQMIDSDIKMYKILLSHIEKDKENYEYGMSLLKNEK